MSCRRLIFFEMFACTETQASSLCGKAFNGYLFATRQPIGIAYYDFGTHVASDVCSPISDVHGDGTWLQILVLRRKPVDELGKETNGMAVR